MWITSVLLTFLYRTRIIVFISYFEQKAVVFLALTKSEVTYVTQNISKSKTTEMMMMKYSRKYRHAHKHHQQKEEQVFRA